MAAGLTEDEIQAQSTRAAAIAMGNWFTEARVLGKRVDQLHMAEMEGAVGAAITGWVLKRAELEKEQDLDQIMSGTAFA